MNGKAKKSMRKILPVGIAMGILFSASPVTEYKVKADVDTFATIVTTFGDIYDAFLKEPFGQWLEQQDAKNSYAARLENVAYKAPTFNKGEFGISVFDYYKDQNFSKKIKIAYANGKVEYKTIKHGEQIRIKDAGTIVDLTPDEAELSKHDILYITQKQLDEGNTGVSLTNFKTYYLTSNNSGGKNVLADRFERQEFPGYFLSSGLRDIRYVNEDLFSKLPEEKRILATITSEPVGKDVLSNYVTNDSKAREDLNNRLSDILADRTSILETPIALPWNALNDGKPYQIIPYKKGTNKVVVKTGSKYLSGKEGNALQYSDSIGDDEVFELVQTGNSNDNKFQFYLKNKNGVSLAGNQNVQQFGTDGSFKSEIRFTGKSNNEIHNWLRAWYPGKENERQNYDGIEFVYESGKGMAKDPSGNVIKNSWVKEGKDYYYAGSDGFFLKDWQEIEGKTYYFQNNGRLLSPYSGSNGDAMIGDKYYLFDDKGALQRSAWKEDAFGLHYSDASGAIIKEGLQEIDNNIYYFKDYKATTNVLRLEDQGVTLRFSDKGVLMRVSGLDGKALNKTVNVTLDNKTLPFYPNGALEPLGVSRLGNTVKYFSLEDGINYSGWKEFGEEKYYFRDGKSSTVNGTETIDGKKYYFNDWGKATQTGFVKTNGKTYYYNDKGEMQTGFQEINGNRYYFFSNSERHGEMATGFFNDGRNNYYAEWDGVMYRGREAQLDYNGDLKYFLFNSEGRIIKSFKI
ncbi:MULTISPECIES: N-acetylmuramoyl-L-alanine amidase family protein [Bacillus cereus group]|uniref:Cell wall-binding protein n=1 Tax=Bacillus proteolyticus TaxID=2026192 RepID=A0ABV3IBG8_9BACI|nr:cell wall-binding protein [Bacillus cereus group sp. N8]MBJ8107725.1 cell wall-binding protein [Bacillus cereus group sp. N8]